jgi:hypothetical protein
VTGKMPVGSGTRLRGSATPCNKSEKTGTVDHEGRSSRPVTEHWELALAGCTIHPMAPRILAAVVLAVAVAPVVAQSSLTRQDADRFQAKLVRIVSFGNVTPAARTAPRSTQLSDSEVNAYLRFHAAEQIPVGIVDPMLSALGDGRVSGQAIVDLDAVRKQKQRGWMDPMGYLTGRMPLVAAGRLTTKDGIGQFELESAEISGVPIPKTVLQELLSYYSRSPEQPAGINMDAPFELPARIREIRVARGTATVVQ